MSRSRGAPDPLSTLAVSPRQTRADGALPIPRAADPDQVGGEFDYHYQDVHRCTIRVTELVPGRKVAWHILDNYFNFIEDQAEWKNTQVVFEISETDAGAEVRFTHVGLVPTYECYDVCSNAWGGYIRGSLRNLIITGQGQPNPKEDGDAPAHQDAASNLRATRSSQ